MKTYYFKYNNQYMLLNERQIKQIFGEKFKYNNDNLYCLDNEINKSIQNKLSKKNI